MAIARVQLIDNRIGLSVADKQQQSHRVRHHNVGREQQSVSDSNFVLHGQSECHSDHQRNWQCQVCT